MERLLLLTLDESFALATADSVNVEFIRFDYDIEKAAKGVESSRLPRAYADMLRKAY